MPLDDSAVDGYASARIDQYRITDSKFPSLDHRDAARTTHRHRARQELEQIADRVGATSHRHTFEHFSNQHEQGDHEGPKEFTDRRCSDDRNAHGHFHGHPSYEDVCRGLADYRPAANDESDNADTANGGKRLPNAEPNGDGSRRDKANGARFGPLKGGIGAVVIVFFRPRLHELGGG